MSTHITPRPRSASASASHAHTRPGHSHRSPSSPFRWSSQRPIPRAPSARVVCLADASPESQALPDPGPWAATLARAIVEVVTGARQAPQLRRWLLPDLYTALANVHLAPCARGATAIHVRVCSLNTGHTEVAVIVATAARTFALALRLEEYRGRWMATALELA